MRRVGIVYPRANLDSVPNVVGVAELMAERGYEVDVFTLSAAGQPRIRFSSPRVTLRPLGVQGLAGHTTAPLRSAARRAAWLPKSTRAQLGRVYGALDNGLTRGSRLVAKIRTRPATYDVLIGVDADGLELASAMARGAVLGYLSLELLLSSEVSTAAEQQLKARERELLRRCSFIMVQDEARGALLASDNDLDDGRLVLLPNAPIGPARRKRSRSWHARFGLAEEQRVVLHAGSLGAWTGVEDLLASVPSWPEPWVFVVHTRYDSETSPYVERLLSRAHPNRVYFSLKPVERHAYDELVDSADVGLAFYVPTSESAYTQQNITTIGLSSGKLAYYLRAGLPVIVNSAASIAAVLDRAGCGAAVSDASQVAGALGRIADRYDDFSRAALDFFDEHLDFRRAFDRAVERVEALAVAGPR